MKRYKFKGFIWVVNHRESGWIDLSIENKNYDPKDKTSRHYYGQGIFKDVEGMLQYIYNYHNLKEPITLEDLEILED